MLRLSLNARERDHPRSVSDAPFLPVAPAHAAVPRHYRAPRGGRIRRYIWVEAGAFIAGPPSKHASQPEKY